MLKHPYHLVDISPWPLLLSLTLLSTAMSFIHWIIEGSSLILFHNFVVIIMIFFQWWRDIIRESKAGYHTIKVQKGILIGFILF